MSYGGEKHWVFWREEERAKYVHAAEENEEKDGFDGRSFEEVTKMKSNEKDAKPCPQEEEEVGGLPAEEFPDEGGRKPISHVVNQHLDGSRLRYGIEDGPIVINEIM